MNTLATGTQATVNGNSESFIQSYDKELDMYNVRLWAGNRHVGDIVVPVSSIYARNRQVCANCGMNSLFTNRQSFANGYGEVVYSHEMTCENCGETN